MYTRWPKHPLSQYKLNATANKPADECSWKFWIVGCLVSVIQVCRVPLLSGRRLRERWTIGGRVFIVLTTMCFVLTQISERAVCFSPQFLTPWFEWLRRFLLLLLLLLQLVPQFGIPERWTPDASWLLQVGAWTQKCLDYKDRLVSAVRAWVWLRIVFVELKENTFLLFINEKNTFSEVLKTKHIVFIQNWAPSLNYYSYLKYCAFAQYLHVLFYSLIYAIRWWFQM